MLTRCDHVWQWRSRALLVALALILVGLRAPPAAGADLVAFKVGISDRVNTVLPLWMAEAGGFYAAQGLKVEIVTMGGGSRGAQDQVNDQARQGKHADHHGRQDLRENVAAA